MNLKRRIKTLLKEGVKVVPREQAPCCCEEQYNAWSDEWDCIGSSHTNCCNSAQQCAGGTIDEDVKVLPKGGPCCCHCAYNPDCGWDCVSGSNWHSKCCPSKCG